MRSIQRTLATLGFAAAALQAPQARADLKLEEALRAALENHEQAKIAAQRVQVARGQLYRARTAFYPSLNMNLGMNMTPYTNRAGNWRTTSASMSLTQPLLNPSAFPNKAQAEHNLEAEQHNAVELQRQLAYTAARAFIQALAAERVFKAAESRFERAKINFETADQRAKAQLNSVNDATRARVEMTTAAQSMAQSRASHLQALVQLGLLMGRPTQEALAPPEGLSEAAKSFRGEVDRLTRSAIDHRPDLRALREQIRSAEVSASEPRYRMAPSVNLGFQIRANTDTFLVERPFDQILSLTLNWNIFDGGARYADRQTRLAQVESLKLQQLLEFRTVKAEIQGALLLLEAAKQSLQAAEEGVAAAKVNIEETAILYQQGLARAIEVTDANARRFDAEVNLASARQSLMEAYLQLRQVLGLPPTDHLPMPAAAGNSRHAPPSTIDETGSP
jgi:outer membrane protein TolC